MFERYAVYYTPDGALAARGAAWLGWDSATGSAVAHPDMADMDLAQLTQTPRKYGFHGTLKPPFHLAPGMNAQALSDAVAAIAASLEPVQMAGLATTRLGGFLALTPRGDTSALSALAARVVMELDPFRAPPSEAELARRRRATLTEAQENHLKDWGYPYVLDQFRFHMTLTGRFKNPDALLSKAAAYFAPALPAPFVVDALTLLGQGPDGMFHQIARYPCGGV